MCLQHLCVCVCVCVCMCVHVYVCVCVCVCVCMQHQGPESRFSFTAPDELVPWRDCRGGSHANSSSARQALRDGNDSCPEPTTEGLLRYCHLYQPGELTALCQAVYSLQPPPFSLSLSPFFAGGPERRDSNLQLEVKLDFACGTVVL